MNYANGQSQTGPKSPLCLHDGRIAEREDVDQTQPGFEAADAAAATAETTCSDFFKLGVAQRFGRRSPALKDDATTFGTTARATCCFFIDSCKRKRDHGHGTNFSFLLVTQSDCRESCHSLPPTSRPTVHVTVMLPGRRSGKVACTYCKSLNNGIAL